HSEPPPFGWLKFNFNSSWRSDPEISGIGWIIPDHTEAHICSGCTTVEATSSSFQDKAMGFLQALQIVWMKGWRDIWSESDKLELTKMINHQEENNEIGILLIDIKHWMGKLPECSLDHTNRERNCVADVLARRVIFLSTFHVWKPKVEYRKCSESY
ncbi:hypothetical protein EUTSA_v10005664mg, partial [Eutrema salsugineum]